MLNDKGVGWGTQLRPTHVFAGAILYNCIINV